VKLKNLILKRKDWIFTIIAVGLMISLATHSVLLSQAIESFEILQGKRIDKLETEHGEYDPVTGKIYVKGSNKTRTWEEERVNFWDLNPLWNAPRVMIFSTAAIWFFVSISKEFAEPRKKSARSSVNAPVVAVIALLGLSLIAMPAPVVATEVIDIDILVVADEEFMSGTIYIPIPKSLSIISSDLESISGTRLTITSEPLSEIHLVMPISSTTWGEWNMDWMSDYFYDNFAVNLRWHFWHTFTSTSYYLSDRLNEAKNQIGWYWGKVVGAYSMELMVVFSQQHPVPDLGLSLPWERMLIVIQDYELQAIMMHEYGHQIELAHCSYSVCCMHKGSDWAQYYDNCGHFAEAMNNRARLLSPPDPPEPVDPYPRIGAGPHFELQLRAAACR
jgi:hypothetical protein